MQGHNSQIFFNLGVLGTKLRTQHLCHAPFWSWKFCFFLALQLLRLRPLPERQTTLRARLLSDQKPKTKKQSAGLHPSLKSVSMSSQTKLRLRHVRNRSGVFFWHLWGQLVERKGGATAWRFYSAPGSFHSLVKTAENMCRNTTMHENNNVNKWQE